MGIFSKAEQVISPKQMAEIQTFLVEGETVKQAYSLVLDFAALTNLRVLFVEKDGTETVVSSLPYNRITGVALAKNWLSSKSVLLYASGLKHKVSFMSGENAKAFYLAITERIL
jgi:hypothetical protein